MKDTASGVPLDLKISLIITAILAVLGMVLSDAGLRATVLLIVALASAAVFIVLFLIRKTFRGIAGALLKKESEILDRYVNSAAIPTALTRTGDSIIWYNQAFSRLAGVYSVGVNIYKAVPNISKPDTHKRVSINGTSYLREIIHSEYRGREYTIFRFIDTEKFVESGELCNTVMASVCHIQVDNYSDLMRGAPQNMQVEIEAAISRLVSQMADFTNAAYLRYERGRFMLVFERRHIKRLKHKKFSILEEARAIKTGSNTLVPTLSIGLGAGKSPKVANAEALKAMEMALGRGGDQAVLKDESGYSFFGGIQQGREQRTKVKTRMFSTALKNLMEQCDKVLIMGHSLPDFDSMGSCLGLFACARRINKKAAIVVDRPNTSVEALLAALKNDPDYTGVLMSPDEAENFISDKSMLIVTDTQIAGLTAAPRLFEKTSTVVVIDHHVRSTVHIENPTLILAEPYASSASEMATEIIQYFSDNIILKPLELEALLAGITIDTKGFSFKTGVRTFDAAAYLKRMGADTTRIRSLFQDDIKTFTAKAKVVENAEILKDGIAISTAPPGVANPQLLVAQAADSLLNIRGIEASFVLCKAEETVIISGRSIGGVNVQRILEKLGGGGHATIAGAQLKGREINEVVAELKEKIMEYESEVT